LGSIYSTEEDRSHTAIRASQFASNAAAFPLPVPARTPPPDRSSDQIPRWLWWNILSLDAPAVAAAWALLFARANGVALSLGNLTALVLAVWLIYVTDRLLDGWRIGDKGGALQARHRFCKRHRTAMLMMAGLAAVAVASLIQIDLNDAEVRAGLLLGALVAGYMLRIHLSPRRRARWVDRGGDALSRLLPKEIAVGFLFAAGTTLPVWSRRSQFSWEALSSWMFFGLLCALNCIAIECWENYLYNGGSRRPSSPLVAWADSRIGWFAAAMALLAVIASLFPQANGAVMAALACAALFILLLNSWRRRLTGHALRVLADAALLLPAILALVVRV
jgi:hypothetical protein